MLLGAAAAVSLSACVTQPSPPPWFSNAMFEELANTEEYSDFLAARYAGMAGDPVTAAEFYRRSFDRSPEDPICWSAQNSRPWSRAAWWTPSRWRWS